MFCLKKFFEPNRDMGNATKETENNRLLLQARSPLQFLCK